MGDKVGSIEIGKKADLVVVDLSSERFFPGASLYSMLVYSAFPGDVVFTMVDGKVLFDRGGFPNLDLEKVKSDSVGIRRKIRYNPG